MKRLDLYVNVWERVEDNQRIVVVVFKGTDQHWPDWYANMRDVLDIIPGFFDQYDEVMDDFDPEFVKEYVKRSAKYRGAVPTVIYGLDIRWVGAWLKHLHSHSHMTNVSLV